MQREHRWHLCRSSKSIRQYTPTKWPDVRRNSVIAFRRSAKSAMASDIAKTLLDYRLPSLLREPAAAFISDAAENMSASGAKAFNWSSVN